jgi:2,4-dienoyl-CoA reductase-like NADH-dependent reductase (Old Yellow Enzyme family)
MASELRSLFSPIKVGRLILKNRIYSWVAEPASPDT